MDQRRNACPRGAAALPACALFLTLGLGASPLLSEDLPVRGSVSMPGLAYIGKSEQGIEEYRHEKSGIVLVLVPAGEFTMGIASPAEEREPEDEDEHTRTVDEHGHKVRISRPFLLGKFEVTHAQFHKFRPEHSTGRFASTSLDGDDLPVGNVSWNDAKAFCDAFGLRLPTEAQWEYVARGKDGRKFPWGNGWPPPKGSGKYSGSPGPLSSSPVGKFPANPFGLHDIEGNVMEWCADWYGSYPPAGVAVDPVGPASGTEKVHRGGCWCMFSPGDQRCAHRERAYADWEAQWLGFRVAMGVGEK